MGEKNGKDSVWWRYPRSTGVFNTIVMKTILTVTVTVDVGTVHVALVIFFGPVSPKHVNACRYNLLIF